MEPTTQQVIDAVQARNYALVAALLLIAAVYGVRKIAPRLHGGLGAFLNSDRGGSLLVLVGGAAGMIGTALAAGKPLSWPLVLGSLMTSFTASGLRNVVWDLVAPADKQPVPSLASTVQAPPAPPLPPAAIILPFLVVGALLAGSCDYCKDPANAGTPRCKAQNAVTAIGSKCAAPELLKLIAAVGPRILVDVFNGNFGAIVADATAALKDIDPTADIPLIATCALVNADANLHAQPGAALAPEHVKMKTHVQMCLTGGACSWVVK